MTRQRKRKTRTRTIATTTSGKMRGSGMRRSIAEGRERGALVARKRPRPFERASSRRGVRESRCEGRIHLEGQRGLIAPSRATSERQLLKMLSRGGRRYHACGEYRDRARIVQLQCLSRRPRFRRGRALTMPPDQAARKIGVEVKKYMARLRSGALIEWKNED